MPMTALDGCMIWFNCLVNWFINYFSDKIKFFRPDLQNSVNTPNCALNVANDFDGMPPKEFHIVHQEEVCKIISSSASKSCSLEPILMSTLKLCIDELKPVLMSLPTLHWSLLISPLRKEPSFYLS